jgi:hypothetical protein
MAEKLTSGQKAAQTNKRRKAAKKAVRTRTMRQAGFKASDTRKRNQMIAAAKAGLQAAEGGDLDGAKIQLITILKLLGPGNDRSLQEL